MIDTLDSVHVGSVVFGPSDVAQMIQREAQLIEANHLLREENKRLREESCACSEGYVGMTNEHCKSGS